MGFILFVHVLVCVLLVITILMQAGKGGGLAESFASAEGMFGTQTNVFLVRTSAVLAAIFLATSLILAVYGSKGEKSLMADPKLLPNAAQSVKKPDPQPEISIKVGSPEAVKDLMKPVVNAAK
ncbi:MAG: preprotein translocase subunit SecG [Candidatus Omnitrophica bacterium]|nr:preprotein translocase subunit SecG [Candidatus Omnitrophota bacterium]